MPSNQQVPSFDKFVDQELGNTTPSFTQFVNQELATDDKALQWEKPDPLTVSRMEGVERSAKPEWWDKFTPLADKMLGGFYGSAGGTFEALAKTTDVLSKATGIEKSDIFRQLSQAYRAREQYLGAKGTQGIAGDVAGGVGGAAFDIPSIMAFGQWGLPIHGGLMGLAEEGIPGAAKGVATGALTHGTLKGIGELPSKMRLPAFAGFGATVTPGGVKERTTGALTWTALGLSGGKKKVSFREFVDRYKRAPKEIQEQILTEPTPEKPVIETPKPELIVPPKVVKPTPKPKKVVEKPTIKPTKPEYAIGDTLTRGKQQFTVANIKQRKAPLEPIYELKTEKGEPGPTLPLEELKEMKFKKATTEPGLGIPTKPMVKPEYGAKLPRTWAEAGREEPTFNAKEDVSQVKYKWSGLPPPKDMAKKTVRKLVDLVQVEPQFKRIGAPQTGVQIKAYNSIRNAEIERAQKATKDLSKLGLKKEDYTNLTYISERPKLKFKEMDRAEKLRLAKSYGQVREFFNKYKREMKKLGIFEEGFPYDAIREMQEERTHLNIALKTSDITPKRRKALRKQIEEINKGIIILKKSHTQYVHIPRTWLDGLFKEDTPKARRIMTEFFHKRTTFDMESLAKHLLDRGHIKPEQVDIRYLMGAYAHQAGHKIALAKIFRHAEKEGLIKGDRSAPDGWSYMPKRAYPSLAGKKVHPVFSHFFERNFTPRGMIGESKIARLMGPIKLLQFYNPLFLPMYDMYQAWWTGSTRSLKTPGNVRDAFRSMKDKDQNYWYMHEHAGFSTPFTPKFEQGMQKVKSMVDGDSFLKGMKKYVNPYRLSWDIAWTGDHLIRMITYHHYLKQKFTPRESAQLTAKAHGDYASIPPKTRRIVNKIFFTPSFKIAMISAQLKMVKSAGKYFVGGPKTPKTTQAMAKMLVGIGTGFLLRTLTLQMLGFEQDKWGLKYTKEVQTDEGKRELVLHVASPDNVFLRLYHRFTKIPLDDKTLETVLSRAKWELHPIYQLAHEILTNKSVKYEPIFNKFDNREQITRDILLYTVRRLIPMTEALVEATGSSKATAGYTALVKDLKGLGMVMSFFSLPYVRNAKEKRIVSQMKGLINEFSRARHQSPPRTPEEANRRRKNLQDKLEKLKKELQK